MPSMMKRFSPALAPSIERPPSLLSLLAPGACVTSVVKSRPLGISSTCSARMLVCRALCRTSTSGDSATTCTDSVTPFGDIDEIDLLHLAETDADDVVLRRRKVVEGRGNEVIARGD